MKKILKLAEETLETALLGQEEARSIMVTTVRLIRNVQQVSVI
jgi:hypothetical protein